MIYPNQKAISKILLKLRCILLPEYFADKNTSFDIAVELKKQISLSLNHRRESIDNIEQHADSVTNTLLSKIYGLTDTLMMDAEAGYYGDPAAQSVGEVIIAYPGFFAVLIYRIAHELYLLDIPLIPRMMSEYAHTTTGIEIHPGASIGESFFIDHGTGVVIGETVEIGKNVKIYQGVTLGALSTKRGRLLSGKKRHPTIEDNVTIYAGAAILGGETVIREGSTIGGNAFIIDSTPGFKGQLKENSR